MYEKQLCPELDTSALFPVLERNDTRPSRNKIQSEWCQSISRNSVQNEKRNEIAKHLSKFF